MSNATAHRAEVPVLLLKTKSTPADKYEEILNDTNEYKPSFLPVLEHVFRQSTIDWLRLTITTRGFALGDETNVQFGGIIFTSQRAVEAFGAVVQSLDPLRIDELLPEALTFYVVGKATARTLRSLGLKCQVLGEDTGNGEALAVFMLDHYNGLPGDLNCRTGLKLPLLFPVGEQRRDIIPKTLQSTALSDGARIKVIEEVVYETGEMTSFHSNLTASLSDNRSRGIAEQWLVVFSPQGCEAMLRCLGWLDGSTGRYDAALVTASPIITRIATIGPTTRSFLIQQFGFEPHVCAETPSPEGVLSGIEVYRRAAAQAAPQAVQG